MKKTFNLNVPNKKPERQADSLKHEIKKYLTRERKKKVPENIDFWDFNCRIGETETNNAVIDVQEINKMISSYVTENRDSFYLEIISKPGYKVSKKK